MKRRAISRALHSQDVCLFCAFRPRVDHQIRCAASVPLLNLRSFGSSTSQKQQAAAKQSDRDDENNFSMLKKNADLSTAFPTRGKARPSPSLASRPSQDKLQPSNDINDVLQGRNALKSSQGGIGHGQQRFPRQFNNLNDGLQNRRNGQEQNQFQSSGFASDTSGQKGSRYGQDRGQNASRRSGYSGAGNANRRVDQEPPSFQIRKVGLNDGRETSDRDGNDRSNRTQANQYYSFQPSSNGRQGAERYAEQTRQDGTSNDRGGLRTRQPFNKFSGQFSVDGSYNRGDQQPGRGREPGRQPLQNQRPDDQQVFDSRRMRGGRGGDHIPWRQDGFQQRTIDRSGRGRARNSEESESASNEVTSVEAVEFVGTESIEAPAGSSFDSAFGDRSGRRALRDKRNRRSDRFEELEVEGMEPAPEQVHSKVASSSRAFDFELAEAEELLYGEGGRKKKKGKAPKQPERRQSSRQLIQLPEFVSVERLARILKVNLDQFIGKLEEEGFEGARYDHVLDSSTSSMFADLYGFEPVVAGSGPVEDLVARPPPEDVTVVPPRPPIVTIMGHVDHGKTTILDFLRKSSVVATEHGGITQHIGAFSVTMPGTNRQITFLDTPGHAAFLEMRRRGANVTDIVVLVVAADDSVKPQTIEAIKHALEARVQLIVAINKVDKADADVERVKQDLTRHDIVVEDYGGDYQVIPVSGKTGQGMDALEEAIITLADVSDFRAERDGPAEGWVLESKVTSGGRVATVLVRRGTLRTGDFIVAGTTWARVRTLRNDAGALVTEAPPGTPVQVDGWRAGDPDAGLEVLQADDEDHAKDVVDLRLEQQETAKAAVDLAALNTTRTEDAEARAKVLAWEAEQDWARRGYGARPKDNEGWVEMEKATGVKQIPFIIKADVAGSVEAVSAAVLAIGNHEITANVIHSAVGELTESDVRRLAATGEVGYAINFNQPVDGYIARIAEAANLRILNHNIIYKVTDDVKERLAAELPPLVTQKVVGEAEIGQVFEVTIKKSKVKIAGCRVTNGTIARASKIRVLRNGKNIYTGTLHSLKNVKKDVTEMRKGTECGMGFHDWEDFAEGDQVQCFEEHEEKRTLY